MQLSNWIDRGGSFKHFSMLDASKIVILIKEVKSVFKKYGCGHNGWEARFEKTEEGVFLCLT
jgi:hypothetical protein